MRIEDAEIEHSGADLDAAPFDEERGDCDQPRDLTLASIPAEDPLVYDMICRRRHGGRLPDRVASADVACCRDLRPRCFYDLVIEVAIVRPGPIQGDMVHPYLRRRRTGEEPVEFPRRPEVRRVLEKTLGVPIFQEQAMALWRWSPPASLRR